MKFKALIFDVDGTLTDTNQVHADNWKNAFEENGLFVDYEEVKKLVGKGGDNLIPTALGHKPSKEIEKNLTDAKGEEFKKSSKNEKFKLFPKAVEILEKLKDSEVKTAIATSASQDDFKIITDNIGVNFKKLVDVLITAEDVKNSKPDPDLIHATLNKLNLKPEECLMIGDTAFDIESAKKAGVKAIGVLTGFHTKQDLEKAGAIDTYRDISEVYENIDKVINYQK